MYPSPALLRNPNPHSERKRKKEMKKEEKQQKFHEAFMKIFFPPQPIQQTPQQQVEDEPVVFVRDGSDANSGSVLNAKQIGEKVMDLIARIRNIHELVQNQIEKSNAIYKQAAEKHHCKIVFDEGELVWANLKEERFQADDDNVEERNASADASDCMSDKLTRSQRKRIRRRKLKEAASRRRKIIGPLLPSTHEDTKGEPSNLEKEKQLHEDSCIDKAGHIDC